MSSHLTRRGKASLLCRISRKTSQWLRKPDVTNRNVEILLTAQQVDECIREQLKKDLPYKVIQDTLLCANESFYNSVHYKTRLELPVDFTG